MNPRKRQLRDSTRASNYCRCKTTNPQDPQDPPETPPTSQQDCFCPNFALECGDTFNLWYNRWLEAKRQGLDLFVMHDPQDNVNPIAQHRIEEFIRSACAISFRTNSFQVGTLRYFEDYALGIVSYEYKTGF
ncbi:hypothetical protein M3197_07580 [Sporosarcina aquimarina]|uniref:hypothetical protein n=1 Tax=Sporosarcina aquimarina TaxID=114975 RepID=UPI00203FD306|nr:hypothetical protein [Sporosarcina aquimarina]MCM3757349.1 hypothetical protein [Sporosarcina aquimarina]